MLSFCHACTYGSTYDIERGATSGRLYLTAQLQLAPCLLQVVHTCGTKMPLSTWLQPGAAALLTWGKTIMTYIRHTVNCAIKMPDTVLAFLSPTVNEVQHLENILYLSPWIRSPTLPVPSFSRSRSISQSSNRSNPEASQEHPTVAPQQPLLASTNTSEPLSQPTYAQAPLSS
jgi:hypothetical protein